MQKFKHYINEPTSSAALNTKLVILTTGLDFDFSSIKKNCPGIAEKYKTNLVRVSDRHFISPDDENRQYLPDELILEDDELKTLSKAYFRSDSPLLLFHDGEDFKIKDKQGGLLPVRIEPLPRPRYFELDYEGYKLGEFVSILGKDRISVFPFEGCEHWTTGKQCLFCGANPGRLKFRKYKHNVYDIKPRFGGDYEKWWQEKEDFILNATEEAIKKLVELDKPEPHVHLFVLSGGLVDNDFAWEIGLKVSGLINKHLSLKDSDSYLNLIPPNDIVYIEKAKELGFKQICYNLEVYGEDAFKQVCPGKNSAKNYQDFLKAFRDSVNIFGQGRVRSNFVLGAQPVKDLVAGAYELAEEGVISDYSIFFPRPGSIWHDKKTLTADEILEFTRELVMIYKKHDFSPFCCAVSSRSSIANEIYQIE